MIRNPWTEWVNPLTPDDLAGLACEDHVESRLIVEKRAALGVEHGPIPEMRFAKLGKAPWTLLVQAVDQHVPAVAALLGTFRFIPNWRIDDVMVSYATDGGGVGAHYDQYDVFLIQGLGRRRWQIGDVCDAETELQPHDDLRLLARFEPVEEWVLEPGDMLYLPPRIAHDGVALGDDCMTYSIGFRAPSRAEIIAQWSDDLIAAMTDDDRFADPDLRRQDNPGEIASAALDRLHAMALTAMQDREAFACWFGRYSTTPKYPDIDWRPDMPVPPEAACDMLAAGVTLIRNPASRFSFVRRDMGVLLFVDGESFDCEGTAATLAESLAAGCRTVLGREPDAASVALLTALYNQGSIDVEVP